MHCLVTGATGFIGTVLVKELHERGYQVTALLLPGESAQAVSPYAQIREGDIRDADAVFRACAGVDAVLHLAGLIDIGTARRGAMEAVNVGGVRNVIAACKALNIGRLVHVSSVHALPELPGGQVMTEIDRFDEDRVEGVYAKTKAKATQLVLDAAAQGLPAVVVQPSGVIGPYEQQLSNIGHLIADFLCGALVAYVEGRYNFVDVRDVADGIIGALEKGRPGASYILSGEVITVEDMLRTASAASGRPMLRTKLPLWLAIGTAPLSVMYYKLLRKKPLYTPYSLLTLRTSCIFSSARAEGELGFHARPVRHSLTDMTHWIMAHHVVEAGGRYKRCAYRA